MKKYIFLSILCIGFVACEKQQDIDWDDSKVKKINVENLISTNNASIIINYNEWVSVLPFFYEDIYKIMSFDNKLFITYIYYDYNYYNTWYWGTVENDILTHGNQNLGSGSGFERLKVIDNELYAIGFAGTYGISKYNETTNELDNKYYVNTNAYDFDIYQDTKVLACGISPFIRMYSGSSWIQMGQSFDSYSNAYCIAVYNNTLYVGGKFVNFDGLGNNAYVIKWNGSSWENASTGINNTVYEFVEYKDKLLCGGKFSGMLAFLNSNNYWQIFENGLNTTYNGVRALYVNGDDLFVGGDFSYAGDVYSPYIARYNGSEWEAIGSNTPGMVSAITVHNNQLYIANGDVAVYDNPFFLRLE